ncbi:hypothetical protein LUCX_79 [Xanthomonas phage vB_XciM_LucasX]|nr:hypothetical protein LUCX_79 [Xanthomonas phage vB_XciM_LucasX]
MRIHARDLAAMPKERLWKGLPASLTIVFDDGEVKADQRQAVFSAYLWGFYNHFPKTPALTRHFIGTQRVGTDTHLKYINMVRWDVFDAHGRDLDNEKLSKLALEETNIFYNVMTTKLEPFVTTLALPDIVEVLEHPSVIEVNGAVTNSDKSIHHAHHTIEAVLKSKTDLQNNILARSVKSGLVKIGQVLQCVGPRGSVTDIDSQIFLFPARSGFALGLYRFYESFIESRTAAKSLTFTEKPLQDTEYFNRRLQLLAGTIRDIYDGDCGTPDYLLWQMSAGDLSAFSGKYYLQEDGTLGTIYDNEECRKNLVGKTLRIRSTLHCDTPDPALVCAKCYGELERSIPYGTNIGHVGATALCKQASQQVLSVKHLDTSASSTGLRFSDYEQRYVRIGNDPNLIFLAPRLKGHNVKLYVRSDEVERLAEVKSAEKVEVLLSGQISQLNQVCFKVTYNGKEEQDLVQVANGSRTSSFSKEMLVYLRTHGWKMLDNGDIEVDLAQWDYDLPIFSTPRRQENMLDYMATIEKFLKAIKRGGSVKSLKDYDTVDAALRGFYELVSSRLFVNIVHLELLVKVCQIRSSKHRDYRPPLRGNKMEYGKFDFNIFHRSQSAAMAFQNHKQQWNNPATYLVTKRPSHPLDQIMLPLPRK